MLPSLAWPQLRQCFSIIPSLVNMEDIVLLAIYLYKFYCQFNFVENVWEKINIQFLEEHCGSGWELCGCGFKWFQMWAHMFVGPKSIFVDFRPNSIHHSGFEWCLYLIFFDFLPFLFKVDLVNCNFFNILSWYLK